MLRYSLIVGEKFVKSFSSLEEAVKAAPEGSHWGVVPQIVVKSKAAAKESRGFVPWWVVWAANGRDWEVLRIPFEKPDPLDGEEFTRKGEDITRDRNGEWMKARKAMALIVAKGMVDCEYAYVKGGALTVVVIHKKEGDSKGWGHLLRKNLGVTVSGGGGKSVKRLSQLNRSYILAGRLEEGGIAVEFPFFSGIDPVTLEAALDGAVVVSKDIVEACWEQTMRHNTKRIFGEQSDWWIPQPIVDKCRKCKVFNGRMLIPGGVAEGFLDGALLKGQFYVSDRLPPRTVITHPCNLKREIKVAKGSRVLIGLDPQPAKDRDATNIQFLVNQPHLFPLHEVMGWLDNFLAKKWEEIRAGKYMEDIHELLELCEDPESGFKLENHATRERLRMAEWVRNGFNPFSAPQLYTKALTAGLGSIVKLDDGSVRVPIPGAVHEQVITDLVAQLIDPTYKDVPQGYIRRWKKYGVHVAPYRDYVNCRADHGGPDQDDFYTLIYRLMEDGSPRVFALRSPNDRGDYSEWLVDEDSEIDGVVDLATVPVLKAGAWPTRKSEMGEHTDDLPDVSKGTGATQMYGVSEVEKDLAKPSTNPGRYINMMLTYRLLLQEDGWLPVELEKAVDVCTQGGSAEQINVLNQHAEAMFGRLITSGVAFPRNWFSRRGLNIGLDRAVVDMLMFDDQHPMDRLVDLCHEKVEKFKEQVTAYVQERFVPAEELAYVRVREPRLVPLAGRYYGKFWEVTNSDEFSRMPSAYVKGEDDKTKKIRGRLTKLGWRQFDAAMKELIFRAFGKEASARQELIVTLEQDLKEDLGMGVVSERAFKNQLLALLYHEMAKGMADLIPAVGLRCYAKRTSSGTWNDSPLLVTGVWEQWQETLLVARKRIPPKLVEVDRKATEGMVIMHQLACGALLGKNGEATHLYVRDRQKAREMWDRGELVIPATVRTVHYYSW